MKHINQIEPSFGLEEIEALKQYIISGGWGTEHTYTQQFEQWISKFTGSKYCSVVPNGTMALIISLMSLGIKPDDEVIVPAMSMIATAYAVSFLGAKPVFVDINGSGCLNMDLVKNAITSKTKAILHVSFNGRSNDLTDFGLPIIEDSCQSLGSYYKGRHIGTFGDIGCFSLSPHKIISTGQGGLIVTNNKHIHEIVEHIKDFGRINEGDHHEYFGINAKFTDFQAVIGLEQLKKINYRIQRKREIYNLYHKELSNVVQFLSYQEKGWTPWMIDIYVENPYAFSEYLLHRGIKTRLMYPTIPSQPLYGLKIPFQEAEHVARKGIWLPSGITLTDEDIFFVCKIIKGFYKGGVK